MAQAEAVVVAAEAVVAEAVEPEAPEAAVGMADMDLAMVWVRA
jgi:hypothetical protein